MQVALVGGSALAIPKPSQVLEEHSDHTIRNDNIFKPINSCLRFQPSAPSNAGSQELHLLQVGEISPQALQFSSSIALFLALALYHLIGRFGDELLVLQLAFHAL